MADPTQTSSWDRELPCPCKGCTIAREQGYFNATQVVKQLHKQIVGPYDNYVCDHCSRLTVFESDVIPYPCPTIQALEGKQ